MVAIVVPGDSAVPIERNQSAPSSTIRGHVGERLDVVDERGVRLAATRLCPTPLGASTACQPVWMSVANSPCS